MRLSSQTDFGLRLLMLMAVRAPGAVSVEDAARRFGISRHHLMKAAQRLSRAGFITSVRGRAGGFRLGQPGDAISLAAVVRTLEQETGLVECMRRSDAGCPIIPACRLPRTLRRATDAFFAVLDEVTLADLAQENPPLIQLLEAAG